MYRNTYKKYGPSLNIQSGSWIIHWFRTIDYCFRFSFYPLTYVNFRHILDNDDRMSSKRRNLSVLDFLVNSTTKVIIIIIIIGIYIALMSYVQGALQ